MENLESIRSQIVSVLSDRYRNIWLHRHSRRQRDVMITLFPVDNSPYRIVSLRNLNSLTYEEIITRLNREINSVVSD